ncbi:PP0621 family protein [Tepidiphilus margaritifer]|uniref:PP0621 family protein n=1 Tax=Tepidiphilus margaritifer TaxID=203471 RepID=UPI000688D0B5|nr:PP0621 family protein [Tepidiphilus margaritifer]
MGTRYNRFFGPMRDAVMRWLFWFLVLLAVVWWARRRFFATDDASRLSGKGARADGRRAKSALEAEPMLQCAHCGVFVPTSEAVRSGGRVFCCQEHREAAERGRA